MIPRVIHFIFFGFTDFEQIHYWAIRSALAVHDPERVILWYSQAPRNNRLWTDIAQRVELRQVDPPTEFMGVKLESYQYKADVLRLQILQEHGGIYLDIDVISLRPFGDLLNHECVVGTEDAGGTGVSNAVILTQPNHPFIKEWLRQTGDNLENQKWAHHAVCLPRQILDSGSWSVHVEPRASFMPFDFRDNWILQPGTADALQNSYTIHLWETIWMDQLRSVNKNSVLYDLCRNYTVPLRIAVYTIAKNEAHQVAGWAASNQEADVRLVCDTGSTDDTVAKLQEQGVWTESISVQPWRFDHARGTALNLLPADIDVCIWQDLDERLLPGWRQEIERHWQSNTTTANHRYRNNNNPWQWHSKIHARHGCHWTGAVHETLRWSCAENTIWLPDLYLDERQDVKPTRAGYLELLEKKIAEGDRSWRTLYFYANELSTQGRHKDSIQAREQSYENCSEGDVVRSYIARTLARGYASINDHDQAEVWFQRAVSDSNERETWFAYAEWCYQRQDWDRCYVFVKKCLSVTNKRDGFTQDPRAWSATVYDIGALAAYNLGLHAQALEWGQQAVSMSPDDARLKKNLEFYQESAPVPLPAVLEIETSSACNRTCGACLRNSHPDRKQVQPWFEDQLMPMSMIEMIFSQAQSMRFQGDLGLSHYNEPLTDPRIVDILRLARQYSFRNVFFHSNGDLLTPELAAEIDGLADWIVFGIYADSPAKERRQAQIQSWFKRTQVRFTSGLLGLTHHGPADNLDQIIQSVVDLPCPEPQDRFIINHRGEMEFCCDDLGGNFGLGSVSSDNTLQDLWFNPRFQRMVKQLKHAGGRRGLAYCESCPRPHQQEFRAKNIKVIQYEAS